MDSTVTGAASDFLAVFGGFSNYVIADRTGTTVELVPTFSASTECRPGHAAGTCTSGSVPTVSTTPAFACSTSRPDRKRTRMATTKQAERTERKPDERKVGKPRTAAQGALNVSCRSGRVRSCRDPR